MAVRVATISDASAIASLTIEPGYYATEAEMASRILKLLHESSAVFVSELDGAIAGWLHVCLVRRLVCLVRRLIVEPFAEMGGLVVGEKFRRRGVGKALVEAAQRWAREQSVARLRVRTNQVRADAKAFYEHLGFQSVKSQAVFDLPLVKE